MVDLYTIIVVHEGTMMDAHQFLHEKLNVCQGGVKRVWNYNNIPETDDYIQTGVGKLWMCEVS